MIAWPFRMLMCCLVTDGGGALILTSAERARDFPQKPVYILGTGESVETPMVSQMEDFTTSKAFRVSGKKAFDEAGITHADVDHLMIYDAFAHLPLYGLEDLGFCKPGEAAAFIRERNTAPGRQAAAEHQRRRPLLHALGHVRHVRPAGERAADARDRAGPDRGRENRGQPRRRRHVRRRRHDHLRQRRLAAMVTVYEHPLSPYAQKVKIALREKAVSFDLALPGGLGAGGAGADFLAANPRAEVPVLIDGETAIFDSTIILEYIEDRWPTPSLLPEDAAERARVRMIEEVMDTHFEAINWGLGEVNWFQRAKGDLANTLTVNAARQTQGFFRWLEAQLGERAWFNGAAFGWGDLCVAPFVGTSISVGNAPTAGSKLAAWVERAFARPSVAETVKEARAFDRGDVNVADLVARGLFKREYRDHRLEWMIKSGGLEVVLRGLEAGNIRFAPDFG